MQATTISTAVAEAQRADRLLGAAVHRTLTGPERHARPVNAAEMGMTIRFARGTETQALEDLARLDSRGRGWAGRTGSILVAEVEGRLVAAMPVDDPGDLVADPFLRTAEIAGLLRLRAVQLTHRSRGWRMRLRPERSQIRPVL
jgi:hypothetical protein